MLPLSVLALSPRFAGGVGVVAMMAARLLASGVGWGVSVSNYVVYPQVFFFSMRRPAAFSAARVCGGFAAK